MAASPGQAPRPASDGSTRTVWTLGLGAFGLAFSLTTTAAYLPPLLCRFTGSTTQPRPRLRGRTELRGTQALWPILAIPILAVIPLVGLLARAEERR